MENQRIDGILDAFAELLAQRVAEKLGGVTGGKEVYTYDELAERYGMSKASIRRLAAAGAFGELVNVGARSHRVTAAGVRQFENSRSGGGMAAASAAPTGKRHAARRDPGPI